MPFRAAAAENNQNCMMRSDATIFLYPNQFDSIVSVLKGYVLRSHHVVIAAAFLPLFYLETIKIPSLSSGKPVDWRPVAIAADQCSEEICIIDRSFFNFKPRKFDHPDNGTQSTSEAHHCLNVRRVVHEEIDGGTGSWVNQARWVRSPVESHPYGVMYS